MAVSADAGTERAGTRSCFGGGTGTGDTAAAGRTGGAVHPKRTVVADRGRAARPRGGTADDPLYAAGTGCVCRAAVRVFGAHPPAGAAGRLYPHPRGVPCGDRGTCRDRKRSDRCGAGYHGGVFAGGAGASRLCQHAGTAAGAGDGRCAAVRRTRLRQDKPAARSRAAAVPRDRYPASPRDGGGRAGRAGSRRRTDRL